MSDSTTAQGSDGLQPMPPAKRQRLQKLFEHASRCATKGDFSYADELFTQCVLGDPGNFVYVSNFLGNLQRQYNNNKKGSKLAAVQGLGHRGSLKKSVLQKSWMNVITTGLELLKINPWDTSTLQSMAQACEALEFEECQLAYLKGALDADIKDPEINRVAARALGRQAKYDDALVCWNRVLQAKPADEEARKASAGLHIEKTIVRAGYEDATSSTQVMADKRAINDREGPGGLNLTPVQKLERAIAKDPANVSLYLQLAEMHAHNEHLSEAEKTLSRALEASGGDVNVRERLEDVQLRKMRNQLDIARRKAQEDRTPDAVELYRNLKSELNELELSVFRTRCERYPSNLGLRYQLGMRLQTAKNYSEAIKAFQEARQDPQRKGEVLLALGQCFHHIEQYKLAMSNYEQAIDALTDKEVEQKNLALYLAGKLALGLKELDKAEKHLTDLAGRDFGYKDVAECLDKVRRLRDDG